MATNNDFQTLRNQSDDELAPAINPEDTRAEVLEKRENFPREQAEKLEREKDARKAFDARKMEAARIEQARKMTPADALRVASADVVRYSAAPEHERHYERQDIGEKMNASAAYAASMAEKSPELARESSEGYLLAQQERATATVRDFMASPSSDSRAKIAVDMGELASINAAYKNALTKTTPDLTPAIGKPELAESLYSTERSAAADRDANNPEDRDERERMAKAEIADNATREARQKTIDDAELKRTEKADDKANTALAQNNLLDAAESKISLSVGGYVVPKSVSSKYNEVEGKFYAKEGSSSRLMFEDKGKALATSSTDKAAIADMVTLAKAKNWSNLALSGSQEFRREAWLQAESQGIKTKGYTPKDQDLATLKSLTQQRQVNTIQPMAERKQSIGDTAPIAHRHDLNKNQAVYFDSASRNKTTNMQELASKKEFTEVDAKQLSKVAHWRGILQEENKALNLTKPQADERIANFDKEMQNPSKAASLPDPEIKEASRSRDASIKNQERKGEEHELSR